MKRASDIIGLPVLCIQTGEQLGTVRDIACDPEKSIFGLVLEQKSLFHAGKVIPLGQIKAIGEDAITVYADDITQTMDMLEKEQEELTRGLYSSEKLKGIKVITTNGNELGLVEDVYFHEELGTIIGYELSEGIVADIREGRKYLPKPEYLTEGKDVLIVPKSSEALLEDRSEHEEEP